MSSACRSPDSPYGHSFYSSCSMSMTTVWKLCKHIVLENKSVTTWSSGWWWEHLLFDNIKNNCFTFFFQGQFWWFFNNCFFSANTFVRLTAVTEKWRWGCFVRLSIRTPSGINNKTIIMAENNAECLESLEMKGAWRRHMFTTDSSNKTTRNGFCFVYRRDRKHRHKLSSPWLPDCSRQSPMTRHLFKKNNKTDKNEVANTTEKSCNGNHHPVSIRMKDRWVENVWGSKDFDWRQ